MPFYALLLIWIHSLKKESVMFGKKTKRGTLLSFKSTFAQSGTLNDFFFFHVCVSCAEFDEKVGTYSRTVKKFEDFAVIDQSLMKRQDFCCKQSKRRSSAYTRFNEKTVSVPKLMKKNNSFFFFFFLGTGDRTSLFHSGGSGGGLGGGRGKESKSLGRALPVISGAKDESVVAAAPYLSCKIVIYLT